MAMGDPDQHLRLRRAKRQAEPGHPDVTNPRRRGHADGAAPGRSRQQRSRTAACPARADALISVKPLGACGAEYWPATSCPTERYGATVTDRARGRLLFLDVDGPLLPFGGNLPCGSPQTVGAPHLARLRLDAGPRLADLPCTLVWATAWLEDANTEIAPLLGLPDLPVLAWPEPTGAQEREDQWLGLRWKTRTLVTWAAGRPFAWVDDEITDADRDWVCAHHRGLSLLRSIEASRGLTDQDFAALNAWLRELP